MVKYIVQGDPKNSLTGSSKIIIESLNNAAKELGLYDESGAKVTYSCIGESFGLHRDATICVYEMLFPPYVLQQLEDKPILGVSRQNLEFILQSGIHKDRCDYFLLGTDINKWKYVYQKNINPNKFRYLIFGESNTRGCLEKSILAFCKQFSGSIDTELYIKDRGATDTFKVWAREMALNTNSNIFYDDRDLLDVNETLEIASTADCCISLNRSSTYNMRAAECMAMGLPSILNSYCGAAEYGIDGMTCLSVDYVLVPYSDSHVNYLQSLGLRHYLFPRSSYPSNFIPCWSEPDINDLVDAMVVMREQENLREYLSYNGRCLIEKLSWERSAVNLSYCLSRLL